ncbi:MAG: hypothetical protein JWP90_1065 [Mycetocola sp.]|jgi:hypothetical protein|nr:hypothetical protein [Mycetocola sp.]MCU1560112.1 hypothetical protein [Mycetocola sp.]
MSSGFFLVVWPRAAPSLSTAAKHNSRHAPTFDAYRELLDGYAENLGKALRPAYTADSPSSSSILNS